MAGGALRRLFRGLCAFSLTPADAEGVVDVDAFGLLVDRLASAGVDSVCVLGSTGAYAYLDRAQRERALAAAVEASAGRVPVLANVSALRTSWAIELASSAERARADGLLLAPMSYVRLTRGEVAAHFRAVAGASWLPLCIYDNPSTTGFEFDHDLVAALAPVPGVEGIKLPPRAGDDHASILAELRRAAGPDFMIGWSGDWVAAPSLAAGADAWFSVVGGLLPSLATELVREARLGLFRTDARFGALWRLFAEHGSLRVCYALGVMLELPVGLPPAPLLPLPADVVPDLELALEALLVDGGRGRRDPAGAA